MLALVMVPRTCPPLIRLTRAASIAPLFTSLTLTSLALSPLHFYTFVLAPCHNPNNLANHKLTPDLPSLYPNDSFCHVKILTSTFSAVYRLFDKKMGVGV